MPPLITTEAERAFAALLTPDREVGPIPDPDTDPPPRRDAHGHRPVRPIDEWEDPPDEEGPREPTEEELEFFVAEWIEECLEDGNSKLDLRVMPGYVEPGYTDPRMSVLVANWNYVSRETAHRLEAAGYATEWCDEWAECSTCYKAMRTQADSYSWKRSYVEVEGELLCATCAKDDTEAYLDTLRGDPLAVHTLDSIDLAEQGYSRFDRDFENGLYPGQDDSPQAIATVLRAQGIEDFIFSLDGVGQFDVRFGVWMRPADEARAVFAPGEGKAKVSPAAALEAALRDLPPLSGEGITVSTVVLSDDGAKVITRTLTPEEFIAGIGTTPTPSDKE